MVATARIAATAEIVFARWCQYDFRVILGLTRVCLPRQRHLSRFIRFGMDCGRVQQRDVRSGSPHHYTCSDAG